MKLRRSPYRMYFLCLLLIVASVIVAIIAKYSLKAKDYANQREQQLPIELTAFNVELQADVQKQARLQTKEPKKTVDTIDAIVLAEMKEMPVYANWCRLSEVEIKGVKQGGDDPQITIGNRILVYEPVVYQPVENKRNLLINETFRSLTSGYIPLFADREYWLVLSKKKVPDVISEANPDEQRTYILFGLNTYACSFSKFSASEDQVLIHEHHDQSGASENNLRLTFESLRETDFLAKDQASKDYYLAEKKRLIGNE